MGHRVQLSRKFGASALINRRKKVTMVGDIDRKIDLVLIADRADRAGMLHDIMRRAGVSGIIRRLPPSGSVVDCARQSGPYREKRLPDLFVIDFANPGRQTIETLRKIAFGRDKAPVPVVVLTSPESQVLLDSGEIDGGNSVMFAPTALSSFVQKCVTPSGPPSSRRSKPCISLARSWSVPPLPY